MFWIYKNRIAREKKTILTMIKIYCHDKHNTKNEPCNDCNELLLYSIRRLDTCKFHGEKPVCVHCSVHCYSPEKRKHIKEIMLYSGPKMIFHSPLLALCHLIDKSGKQNKLV